MAKFVLISGKLKFSTKTDGLPSTPCQSLYLIENPPKSQKRLISQLDGFYNKCVITQDGVSVKALLSEKQLILIWKEFTCLIINIGAVNKNMFPLF